MKKIFILVFLLLSLPLLTTFLIKPVFAQETSFDLTNIGVTETAGRSFNTWTYYGENPVFKGTAPAGQTVTIKIDDQSFSATADDTGSWIWQPTILTAGSYAVVVSFGQASDSFTLNTQPNQSAQTSTNSSSTSNTSAQTLPQSGSTMTTVYLSLTGLTMIGLGMMMTARPAFNKNNQY